MRNFNYSVKKTPKVTKNLRNIVLWGAVAVLFTAIPGGCTKRIYVPVEHRVEIAVHDTTYLRWTDTLVRVENASLSRFTGLLDTLRLKSSLAEATAYVDTTKKVLCGTLEQRGEVPVRVVERERVVTRDSVVYQDRPVPVVEEKVVKVVPLFWRIFAVLGIVATAGAVFWLLRRFNVL